MKEEECAMVYSDEDVYYMLTSNSTPRQIQETLLTGRKNLLMCQFNDCAYIPKENSNISSSNLDCLLNFLVAVAVGVSDEDGVCYVPFDINKTEYCRPLPSPGCTHCG